MYYALYNWDLVIIFQIPHCLEFKGTDKDIRFYVDLLF